MFKKLRYFYWYILSYVKKHYIFLIFGFLTSFFGIFLYLNFAPSLYTYFYRQKEIIGVVGQARLDSIPEDISRLISTSLVISDFSGNPIPSLATIWEVSEDKKTYTFHLKQNELWTDKKPFVSDDIKDEFRGVTKINLDDYTIKYVLPQPLSLFPLYLTKPLIRYPLIGIGGTYRVDLYKIKDEYITELSLNPEAVNLPYRIYRFFDSEDKLLSAYKLARITEFSTYKSAIAEQFNSWKNTQIEKIIDGGRIITLFFNTSDKSIFNSRDYRKAFVYSLPVFNKDGVKAISPILPNSWAFDKSIKQYIQDIDRARSLLPDDTESSQSTKVSLYTFYDYLDVAEKIKEASEKVGFSVTIQIVSYIPESFDLLLTSWNPPVDPDQYYYWHSSQKQGNITKLNNPRIDKILEDGRKTFNQNERKDIYFEFQHIFMEELPAYFLYHPYKYIIKRK